MDEIIAVRRKLEIRKLAMVKMQTNNYSSVAEIFFYYLL